MREGGRGGRKGMKEGRRGTGDGKVKTVLPISFSTDNYTYKVSTCQHAQRFLGTTSKV